jgi:hypothetical protein
MSEESAKPDLVERARGFGDALARRDLDAATSGFVAKAVYDASQAGVGTCFGDSGLILRIDVAQDIDEARASAERLAAERK